MSLSNLKGISNTHERVFAPGTPGGESVLRELFEKAMAAHVLGIPFKIETRHTRGFRGGGNVNKADIFKYILTVGSLAKDESDED